MASWLAGATGLDELRGQLQAPERVLQQQAERTGSPLLGSVANTVAALRRAPREQIEPRRAGLSQWLEHLAAARGRLRSEEHTSETPVTWPSRMPSSA